MTLPIYIGRSPSQTTLYAHTVRPDLWPPGSRVRVVIPGANFNYLATTFHWAPDARFFADRLGHLETPGAVEALVLSGVVHVLPGDPGSRTWTEVTP